ncbi:MAG: cysteine desulfurase family protein [Blastochloris sp.]|nr:cysteine desulfurase family protein [Blastochloris sp.]
MPRPVINLDLLSTAPLPKNEPTDRDSLDEAREAFRKLIGAAYADEIFFTSSATESANWALKGLAWPAALNGKKHLVLSCVEHPAVEESARYLESTGCSVARLGVDGFGRITLEHLQKALQPDTFLVATHLGNYDVGTLQPVREISAICQEKKIPFFCDASTTGGWLPINVQELGCDLLSLAPHRFYGPQGVGVLYVRRGLKLTPLIHGGRQEFQQRAGMENSRGVIGAGLAAKMAWEALPERSIKCRELQSLFLEKLGSAVTQWKLNGAFSGSERDPHHLSISFLHVEAEALALRLDLRGIKVGANTGCRTRELRTSRVLNVLGVELEWALGTVLIGLSDKLSEEDVSRAVDEIAIAVGKLRGMSSAWKAESVTSL